MEENKKTTQEEKVEFNFEEEVDKSKIIKSFPGKAEFVIVSGRIKGYQLKCATKIGDKLHTRMERLSENRDQFLIKYLSENGKKLYNVEFQVRQSNNEPQRLFYCWIVTFTDNYKYPMLVKRDERNYLENFVLPQEYIEKKQDKVAK